jgi:hypothetical protein
MNASFALLVVAAGLLILARTISSIIDDKRRLDLYRNKGESSVQGKAAHSLSTEKMQIRKSAREKGIIGESGIGQVLAELAEEFGLIVLHDLAMPDSKANIDHILVSSKAVFVIDAKNYVGKINIRKDQSGAKQLWVGRYKRTHLADKLRIYSNAVKSHLVALGFEIKVIPILAFYEADFDTNTSFTINGVSINAEGIENEVLRYASGKTETFDTKEVSEAILQGFPHKN